MAKLIGDKPNQVPTNADLGDLAYVDMDNIPSINVDGGTLVVDAANGRVGVGTNSPQDRLHLAANAAGFLMQATGADAGRQITGIACDNGNFRIGTRTSTSTFVSNDYLIDKDNSGATVHAWRTGNVERMRITSTGDVLVGQTSTNQPGQGNTTTGIGIAPAGLISISRNGFSALSLNRNTSDGGVAAFFREGSSVGTITVTATTTAYNTSSDYRLKEDVQPMVGASDRVLSLNPVNFAWKADGSRVDGFLAHEAQAVVPEAVTGEKDGEEMQAIDQSKLVPLLTAALQEALTKIEQLEARISALET